MSIKKVLCLLLAVAMCATLVACGSTDDTVTTTTAGDTVTTTTVGDDDTTTTVEGEDTTTAEGEDTTTVEGEDVITTVEDEVTTTVEDEVTTTIKDKTTTKDKVTTTKNKVTTTKNKVTTTKNKVTTTTKDTATTTKVQSSNDDGDKGLSRDEVIAKMPANLKNTKVTYFYWHNPHERMEGQALEELKQKTGIELVYEESSANQFYDELVARVTAGNSPDMVRSRFTSMYALAGLQSVDCTGFDFDGAWDKTIMDAYTINGKCYGINLENSAVLDVRVMYYNRRALKATSGLEDPYELWKKGEWTWDKFWEMCEAFVASKRGAAGYYGASFEYSSAYVDTRCKGIVTFDTAQNKYVNNFKDPEYAQAWAITIEKYEKGILVFGDRLTDFDEGKILFFSSGPFSCRTLDPRQKVLKVKKNLGTVPLPSDETTKYTPLYEATAISIPMGAKNAAAVPYVVRYMWDQQSYDMKDVYCDDQAYEAVNAAISLGNFSVPDDGYILSRADNPVRVNFAEVGLQNIKTEIDAKAPAVEAAVEEANNRLKTFNQ